MSLSELLSSLQALPRPEKLQVIHFLSEKLLEEELLLSYFQPGASYPVWSPFEANEAAAKMHKLLEKEKTAP